MFKKFVTKFIGFIFGVALIMVVCGTQFHSVFSFPENSLVSFSDVEFLNSDKTFGQYISAKIAEEFKAGNSNEKETKLIFKLFGFLPIRQINVKVSEDKLVYLGGEPLGFAVNTQGVIIVGENSVLTNVGPITTQKSVEICVGDLLVAINDESVLNENSVIELVQKHGKKPIKATFVRGKNKFDCNITPALDEDSQLLKIGLWVRGTASGVGTLTFIDSKTNKYGALGHPITDFETGIYVPVSGGSVYKCNLVGINKGKKGEPGELRCLFLQGNNQKGTVEKNTKFGVFGEISKIDGMGNGKMANVASRMTVSPGPAKIVSSVSGICEEYDIEIIKANYQPESNDKSLVFRVKDKRLLELTGGIVQGMSGSPILQNGKLIGAVTHVFVSDCTKGYGIYADWMLGSAT
ncbi:MAG: SpoIVB peptidase [Clostridia bacterium]